MAEIILNPQPEHKRSWGILAHVPAAERDRILSLPGNQRKYAVAQLEREVREARKKSGR